MHMIPQIATDYLHHSPILSRYILKHKIKGYIFIKMHDRKRLSVDNVQKLCQRLAKQLNIKQSITPHKWRHTFATRFAERNGNMEVLRIILGHTSLTTTQRYLHVGSNKLRDEYKRVIK
jgi:site-specific recombinase XerD